MKQGIFPLWPAGLLLLAWLPGAAQAQFTSTRIVGSGDVLPDGRVVGAPSFSGGGGLSTTFGINNHGDASYVLQVIDPANTSTTEVRLFKTSAGVPVEVAREGQVYAGHVFVRQDFVLPGGYPLADDGSLTFAAGLNASGTSLVRSTSGGLQTVFLAGQASPDGNGTATVTGSFSSNVSANRAGGMMLSATLAGGSTTTSTDQGFLLLESGSVTMPVREGVTSTAPGFVANTIFSFTYLLNATDSFGGFPLVVGSINATTSKVQFDCLKLANGTFQVLSSHPYPTSTPSSLTVVPAYASGLTASGKTIATCLLFGPGVDSSNNAAVAIVGKTAPIIVMRTGSGAPGGGGTLTSLLPVGANQQGAMMILAQLTGAPDGATTALFYSTPAGVVTPLLRQHAPVPGVADRRFNSMIPIGFNASGNALILAGYEDGAGTSVSEFGVYFYRNGVLTPVLGKGSTLDGKTVDSAVAFYGALNDANQILLTVIFSDVTFGLYRIDFGGVVPPGFPDIAIEQPAANALEDGQDTIDFGDTALNTTKTLTFTVKNTGTATLSSLSILKDGPDAANFTVAGPLTTTLAKNAKTIFTVSFKPTAAGTRNASIHVLSNDSDEYPFDIDLIGNSVAKPAITTQPVSQLVRTGDTNVSFTVAASGGGTQTVKWLKNGIAVAGASGPTFTIPTVSLSDAANYNATVTTAAGSATSNIARLGVVDAGAASVIVNNNATMKLAAPAKLPTGAVPTYLWKKGGSVLSNTGAAPAQVVSGVGTATLSITKMGSGNADAYTCVVGMDGLPTQESGNQNVSIRFPPVVTAGSFAWLVSGTVTDQIGAANNATKFVMTGLPAGVTYNASTGQLGGKPNTATTMTKTFTVIASNLAGTSPPVPMTYTVAALPAGALGTFNGLVERSTTPSAHSTVPGTKLQGHGGVLSNLVITSTGSFTATLKLDEKSYAMPAASRLNAHAASNPDASVTILRGTATDAIPDLNLSFQINPGTGELTGSITDGTVSVPLSAWRNPWHTTAPANPATAYAGNYTAALLLDPALAGTDPTTTPPGNAANAIYPQGAGHATLAITPAGAATWGGRLADNSVITFSTTLGPNGEVPLHLLLYTPTIASTAGSLHGWTKIAGTNLDSVAPFDWLKLAQAPNSTTRSYKAGFPRHNLTLTGGLYAAPTSGSIVFGLPNVAAGTNNAKLIFSEGGIGSAAYATGSNHTLIQGLRITGTNTVSMPTIAQGNIANITMSTFSMSTGAVGGVFTLKDGGVTRLNVPWSGVLVPRLSKGYGQFQLAQMPTITTSPPLSGNVVFVDVNAP